MARRRRGLLAIALLAAAGCSEEAPPPSNVAGAGGGGGAGAAAGDSGSGGAIGGAPGAGGSGAAPVSGGASSVGGASGGGGGTSGTGATGAGGGNETGGGAGLGGSGGASGGGAGAGGSGAGAGGAAGGAGGGAGTGGAPTADPSDGCGKGGRPAGGLVTVGGSHIYWFPDGYDGTTPMPLIMAFHAAGNQNTQLRNITQNSALAEHFVMAFPKSQGNGWSFATDRQRVDQHYDTLLADYCIDTSRVFATGHSSGAQMIVQLMCAGEDRFRAIAPVASSAYCQSWPAPVPSLIIHGQDDRERASTNQDADGRKDLAPYLASNGCQMSSVPRAQAGCSRGSMQVDPGCVEYQGCSEPTIWCQHDDPEYGMTNHGWPCFANDAMDAFFRGLP